MIQFLEVANANRRLKWLKQAAVEENLEEVAVAADFVVLDAQLYKLVVVEADAVVLRPRPQAKWSVRLPLQPEDSSVAIDNRSPSILRGV